MDQWEYEHIFMGKKEIRDGLELSILNNMGLIGWQFTGLSIIHPDGSIRYTMMRKKTT